VNISIIRINKKDLVFVKKKVKKLFKEERAIKSKKRGECLISLMRRNNRNKMKKNEILKIRTRMEIKTKNNGEKKNNNNSNRIFIMNKVITIEGSIIIITTNKMILE